MYLTWTMVLHEYMKYSLEEMLSFSFIDRERRWQEMLRKITGTQCLIYTLTSITLRVYMYLPCATSPLYVIFYNRAYTLCFIYRTCEYNTRFVGKKTGWTIPFAPQKHSDWSHNVYLNARRVPPEQLVATRDGQSPVPSARFRSNCSDHVICCAWQMWVLLGLDT